ncbi:MAG: Rab family GTPase [Candidatus Hodarchaeales archaeon]|jgi:small GTP-binding protein
MPIRIEDDVWQFKIIIAGEGSVGKTTLINRYISGAFTFEYKATIGANIFTKEIRTKKDNKDLNVKLHLVDVAGQTFFQDFRKKFFLHLQSGFLVFDLTTPSSLTRLHTWLDDIRGVTGENIPLILIGNKVDLEELITVTPEEVATFIEQHDNIIAHFNTSAKTGENVEEALLELITRMLH